MVLYACVSRVEIRHVSSVSFSRAFAGFQALRRLHFLLLIALIRGLRCFPVITDDSRDFLKLMRIYVISVTLYRFICKGSSVASYKGSVTLGSCPICYPKLQIVLNRTIKQSSKQQETLPRTYNTTLTAGCDFLVKYYTLTEHVLFVNATNIIV